MYTYMDVLSEINLIIIIIAIFCEDNMAARRFTRWSSNDHDRAMSPLEHVSQLETLSRYMFGHLPVRCALSLHVWLLARYRP